MVQHLHWYLRFLEGGLKVAVIFNPINIRLVFKDPNLVQALVFSFFGGEFYAIFFLIENFENFHSFSVHSRKKSTQKRRKKSFNF